MPTEGSIAHQPNLLMEAFDQLTMISNILDEEDYEKRNKNAPNGSGGE